MKYWRLGVPFIERFFDLAQQMNSESRRRASAGLIVANSFMKREFGKKLIEEILPMLDLTHVVDCSGAYIPGHGTPTAILFGRNQRPVASVVRIVRGVREGAGGPGGPSARVESGQLSLLKLIMRRSESPFVSTERMGTPPRSALGRHPWNMGGGGAAEVQEA